MRFVRPAILGVCLFVLAFAGAGLRPRLTKLAADVKTPPAAHDPQRVSDQEWVEAILPWMRKYRPNQASVLDNMSDGSSQKAQAKQLVANQYWEINRIANPPLQTARLNEITAQDELFGAQLRLRAVRRVSRGPRLDQKALEDARAGVQLAVSKLFDAQIAEKKVRLERLQSEVDRLQQNIDRMEKNKATVVAKWTNGILNQQGGRNSVDASPPPSPPDGPAPDEINSAAKR